jgi:type IV secretion system protein TrbL
MVLLLWLAAIGHLLVMITRSAALIVLAAITPAAAAGLVSDAGRTWFWKSPRWFLAAAFTPVLMVLMLGIGVQLTTGVANGLAEGTQRAIGTALPGVILILIACVAPVALFKLLAFVDPN